MYRKISLKKMIGPRYRIRRLNNETNDLDLLAVRNQGRGWGWGGSGVNTVEHQLRSFSSQRLLVNDCN